MNLATVVFASSLIPTLNMYNSVFYLYFSTLMFSDGVVEAYP